MPGHGPVNRIHLGREPALVKLYLPCSLAMLSLQIATKGHFPQLSK